MTRAQRSIMKELLEDDEQRLQKHIGSSTHRRYRFRNPTAYRGSMWVCTSTVDELQREGWIAQQEEPHLISFKATWKAHSELN